VLRALVIGVVPREQRARELAERDAATSSEQLREQRSEVARLRDELQVARSEGEAAKLSLARIEGARSAEEERRNAEAREQQLKNTEKTFNNRKHYIEKILKFYYR